MLFTWLKNKSPSLFLSPKEKQSLIQRVQSFEKITGCELVFHFRRQLGSEPVKKNKKLFYQMKLHQTSDRRGMLITLALWERQAAFWADEGILKFNKADFCQEMMKELTMNLKGNPPLQGLLNFVNTLEKSLSHLPKLTGDTNELPDTPVFEGQ